MGSMVLLVDIDRCIRCHACEVACKQENDLPEGPRWACVETVGPRVVGGELHQDFVFGTCVHCDAPACLAVCSTGAISKSEEGLVLVDEDRCRGCGLCVLACPLGAVHFHPERKKVWKCDQCSHRVEGGAPPSCVQHCAGGALQYVTEDESLSVSAGRHAVRLGRVRYVSAKWRLAVRAL
jgi:Fe-S-cluster-containing dehydrogenase component